MKKLFTLTFLLFSLLGNVLFLAQTANAGGDPAAPAPIGNAFTYVVKRGDSLSVIARRYGITLNALVQANRLTRWTIYPGQQLTVPSKTTPSTGSTPPQTPAPSKNKSIYVSMSQQRMYVYENGAQIYTIYNNLTHIYFDYGDETSETFNISMKFFIKLCHFLLFLISTLRGFPIFSYWLA